jgi:uncharacterized protein
VLWLLWDASALVKRYAPEVGSDTVDALFAEVPARQMAGTFLGYAETYASLHRKRNRGDLSAPTFLAAITLLHTEVLADPDWRLLPVDTAAILDGLHYVATHNLNSSDAAILATFLRYADAERSAGSVCVLIAADQRFLRAAQAEGLQTLDPQAIPAADIPAFLASL